MTGGKLRLGVVFGGRSAEHEVSVMSAMDVLAAADGDRFAMVPFGVTRDGRWLTPGETRSQLARADAPFQKRLDADVPQLLERRDVLGELRHVDVVFPLVHGVNGEDGTLQGMLEMFGVPYCGCAVTASAIGMDKALQKKLFSAAGLKVARYLTVREHEWEDAGDDVTRGVETQLGYPAFVKPSNGGSSLGVSKVRSREDLGAAMRSAFALDRTILVEEAIAGRELDCGVLGNDDPQPSPVGEVVPAGEFYDYAAKYLDDSARTIAPADIPDERAAAVQESAVRAFRAIDAAGFSRVDFLLPDDGAPVVNEINTLPGFRPMSMFPHLWSLAGLSYRELISRIVDLALERSMARTLRDAGR
ncbi:MAG: D-alanine--D-alanine ligase [Dehalococcoidia bacterium]|nr:D-alanine--D-alanine ligase [Dehalococcoidia bacterium]